MKKYWKIFALVMAVMLLCTACEERKTIDLSDGGDGIGSAAAAKPAQTAAAEKPAEPAEKETAAAETSAQAPEEEPPEEQEEKTEEAPPADLAAGKVKLVEMTMNAKAKGMTLVPVENGAVFVLNNVLTDTCTITTDPKDYVSASCKVNVEENMDAAVKFVLLQNGQEILTKTIDAALNTGENSIQVLIRLGSAASGTYEGKLFVNGELIGTQSVTA